MAQPTPAPGRFATIGRFAGPIAGLAIVAGSYVADGTVSPAARVAAIATAMAVLWMSEAIPLAVTALFPLVLFPLVGICSTKVAASGYADPPIFLFLGGFMIARMVEVTGLHRRIAIGVIGAVGDRPRRLVLGFMITSALLSMWISNTATTLALLPVVLAVARPAMESGGRQAERFATALLLGTAYGASIGGIGTPIGSPPNVIFLAQLRAAYPELSVSFARWMLLGVPIVLVFLPCAWLWLVRGLSTEPLGGASRDALQEQRHQLGVASRDEKWAAGLFALAGLGWLFRSSIVIGGLTIPGWADLLGGGGMIHDAVVAVGVALIAFFIPSSDRPGERLLEWRQARQISWGLLLLFGGGISLAGGFQRSGLSQSIGELFSGFAGAPVVLITLVVTVTVIFLTEMTSNTATTTVMMPILAAFAISVNISPMVVMYPAAVAASCAFMLPVATPPNAVVFSSGHVSLQSMMRAGLFLNIVGCVLITLLTLALGRFLPALVP